MNKRGEQVGMDEVIFIILNITFFVIFLFFVINISSGAPALEQFYAKQIALIIDNSDFEQIIKLDMTNAKELAEKNNIDLNNMVRITDNKVIVTLGGDKGYSFPYFNNVKVEQAYESEDDTLILNLAISKNE